MSESDESNMPPFIGLAQPRPEFLPCGHHHSLMLKSAETGEPLYCELCDLRTQYNDLLADLARVTAERDAIAELNQAQFLEIENCRLLAARNRNEEWAQNILCFCDGAGVRAVTMRQVKAALAKGE